MLRHRYDSAGLGQAPGGEESPVKAVRIHGYHQQPVVDEVPEPSVKGPLDVVVKIGGEALPY